MKANLRGRRRAEVLSRMGTRIPKEIRGKMENLFVPLWVPGLFQPNACSARLVLYTWKISYFK